jgi:CheY-like chemotaxis protein
MPATTTAKKVLIADPSEKSRQALSHFLREKGMEVIEAVDGSKALAEALLKHPDILLLDLSVGVLGPERLVQILRTNPNTNAIPIFFLSDKEQSVSGFRAGEDEFIRRPFHEEEILLRIQRTLFRDSLSEVFSGDSEIGGNLAQVFLPDLWQMLSLNQKSGIIQVEGDGISGSIYIERGEIVSAVTQNIVGEKALFRMIPLRQGKFRFIPGKVGVRRTIHAPSERMVMEGMRQYDELEKLGSRKPAVNESVVIAKDVRSVAGAGGAVREILLLAEFCNRVEDIVNNCSSPDLLVYETLLQLKSRGILKIGVFETLSAKSEFLPPEDLARMRSRMEERSAYTDGTMGQIAFFLPDSSLLEGIVLALGQFREFEVDSAFFALRRKEGFPIGMFGRIRVGQGNSLMLYALPYLRSTSPVWYAIAPRPVGIIAFLKDEVSSSLEGLLAVSDYTRGVDARVVLAVMGKTFTNFGLGENTLRLFQNRVEKLGGSLKVQEMERLSPEEIRDALARVVRQYLEGEKR